MLCLPYDSRACSLLLPGTFALVQLNPGGAVTGQPVLVLLLCTTGVVPNLPCRIGFNKESTL